MPDVETLLHARQVRPAWRVLLLLLMAAVCWLAFTPNPSLPGVAAFDKLNHLLAFVALSLVATLSQHGGLRQHAGVAAGLLAFGFVIELVQTGIPGRSGEWRDLAADGLGTLAGMAGVALLRRLRPLGHGAAG